MTPRDQLAELVLQLDVDDRADLADLLEGRLQADGWMAEEASSQWTAEIDRRIDAYERGGMASVSMEERLTSVRTAMDEQRRPAGRQ